MPPGFFLFHRYSPGKIERTGRYSHVRPARPQNPQEPPRTPKNPVYEAGESASGITTEYSMRYPDLLS